MRTMAESDFANDQTETISKPLQDRLQSTSVFKRHMIFLWKFLKHTTRVGCFTPSSRQMAREACRYVDSNNPQIILELGAGTGAVTREIIRQKHPQSRLIAVELDPDFAKLLRESTRAEDVEILVADVKDLPAMLEKMGITKFDLIISCLPTPSLPKSTVATVHQLARSHGATGWFSQVTFFPFAFYRKFYERMFGHVEYRVVTANVPPGGAYHCRV